MEFLLPRLHLEPTFTEGSVTDVKWHDALCDKVTFIPWEKFDDVVIKTDKKRDGVHSKFVNSAKLILCANTGESPESSAGSADRTGSTAPLSSTAGEQPVFDTAYMIEFYSDSTSTDGLHDNLFRATGLLLRGIHEENSLRIVNRGYSSQLGMEFDAADNHLPHHITIRPDRILAHQPPAQLQKLPITTFEWKGPGLDFTCMGGDSGSASIPLMKLLLAEAVCSALQDNPKGPHPFPGVMNDPIKEERKQEEKSSELCSNFSRTSKTSSRTKDASVGSSQAVVNQDSSAKELNGEKIVKILIETSSRFESLISAPVMATLCNFLFRDRGKTASTSIQGTSFPRLTRLAVAQSISQRLLSQFGCFFLSTYLMGLAFEIRGLDENGKVIVAVSRPYHCHMKPGIVYAILALAHHSVERLNEGGRELSFRIRKCADVTSTSSFELRSATNKEASSSGNHADTTQVANAVSGSSSKRHKKNDTAQHDTYTDSQDCHDFEEDGSGNGRNNEAVNKQKQASPANIGSPVTYFEDHPSPETNEYVSEQLRTTFERCRRVLAVGGSGVILEETWNGFTVAIKTWNGCRPEGKPAMVSEIEMYQDMFPTILGDAIPRFFLGLNAHSSCYGSVYENDTILITELVGQRVWRDSRGFLKVGELENTCLSQAEELELCNAALKSLRCLHNHAIVHGDVALRNLRAASSISCSGDTNWKAWWIDLGNAKNVGPPVLPRHSFAFKYEIEICRGLFAGCRRE